MVGEGQWLPVGMIRLSGCGGPEGPVFPWIPPVAQIARFWGGERRGSSLSAGGGSRVDGAHFWRSFIPPVQRQCGHG